MALVIYGAQAIALGTYNAIKELYPGKSVDCFLVTEKKNNPSTLGGIPVRELSEYALSISLAKEKAIEVLIATPENVMETIEKNLDEAGIINHRRIDSMIWADLQEQAFGSNGKFLPLTSYPIGEVKPQLSVYKMVHHKDKSLMKAYEDMEYIIPVQVGASNTDVRISSLADDMGDNISSKNCNYSELTGLYWIWKNRFSRDEDTSRRYVGLAHYRRMIDLSIDDQLRMCDNDIDVILPYPMPYEPDIEEHHKRYLSNDEWAAVLKALEELQPEYAHGAKEILKQEYLYNYNIIIAKEKVLSDYCEWLFPILFKIEQINNPQGDKTPNRYIGYIGETLETLYFMYNKDKLKIAHTGCRFLR